MKRMFFLLNPLLNFEQLKTGSNVSDNFIGYKIRFYHVNKVLETN